MEIRSYSGFTYTDSMNKQKEPIAQNYSPIKCYIAHTNNRRTQNKILKSNDSFHLLN